MSEKKEKTFKQHIMDMLSRLPDDTSRDEVLYRVHVIANFEAGIQSAEENELISQEDMEWRYRTKKADIA